MANRPIAHYILQAGSSNKKQPNRPLPASWRRQRSHQPPSDPVGAAQFCAHVGNLIAASAAMVRCRRCRDEVLRGNGKMPSRGSVIRAPRSLVQGERPI